MSRWPHEFKKGCNIKRQNLLTIQPNEERDELKLDESISLKGVVHIFLNVSFTTNLCDLIFAV